MTNTDFKIIEAKGYSDDKFGETIHIMVLELNNYGTPIDSNSPITLIYPETQDVIKMIEYSNGYLISVSIDDFRQVKINKNGKTITALRHKSFYIDESNSLYNGILNFSIDINYIKKAPRYCIVRNLANECSEDYEYFKDLQSAMEKFNDYERSLYSITMDRITTGNVYEYGKKLCRVSLIKVEKISNLELSDLISSNTEKDFFKHWDNVFLNCGETILHSYTYFINQENNTIDMVSDFQDDDVIDDGDWLVEREMILIDEL